MGMTPQLDTVLDATAVRQEALSWPDRARATVITDAAGYERACELLKGIKGLRLKIAETFDPHVKRALEMHRGLVREKAEAEAPLTEAETLLKRALSAYDDEQARLQREEEQRVREALRQQEEAKRLEEAAALEREAVRTSDQALLVEAQALIEEPVVVPAPVIPRATPKVSGITYRETWSARVVNLRQLVAHVAAHPECLNYLSPNVPALNQTARAQKQGFKVPGVEAICQKSVAAGSR
jgi:hypothetical protein